MAADVNMQVLKVFSFEITNLISIGVNNFGPGTYKLMWDCGLNDLIASISITVSFDVAITKMMLCGDHISKNSGAKRTLVSDNHHVDMVTKVVSR